MQGYAAEREEVKIDSSTIKAVLNKVLQEKRSFLLAHEGQAVMQAAGISIPRSIQARSVEEAVQAAEKIGYPVVMKVISRDILHKSDAGGVALDLMNEKEVVDAYQAIMRSCRAYLPQARIEGVEISEMVEKGIETIIGARRDNTFGPLVMFGLGGIYVEVMKDVTFRALPINQKEARKMIKEIRAYPLLMGVRGEEKKDIEVIVHTLLKVGAILQEFPMISDLEINPFVIYEQGRGGKAVDVRIMLTKEKRGA
ncbi:MAG: acetate--CoA ligase family protein [Thermodesulfobacteriota bacterium]